MDSATMDIAKIELTTLYSAITGPETVNPATMDSITMESATIDFASMDPVTNINRKIYNATTDFAKIVPSIMGPCIN